MTREEAITVLKALSDNPLFSDQHRAAFSIAIHDVKSYHDWNINNLILINKDNYEPRVDFEELKRKIFMEVDGGTDDKWLTYGDVCDRISKSIDEYIADMREVEK